MAKATAQGSGGEGMGGMGGMMPAGGASGPPEKKPLDPLLSEDNLEIDPDVRELGDYFNIEERWIKRLNETMRKRKDTKEQDIAKLYEVLERARSPTGLLTVKIGEMECGQFVGKIKPDKDVERLARKFKLDDQAETKLADILCRYDEAKRKAYIVDIERHLEVSNRPSAMAMMMLRKLGDGVALGRPGPVAPGSYLDKVNREKSGRSSLLRALMSSGLFWATRKSPNA